MSKLRLLAGLFLAMAGTSWAQLISSGTSVPRGSKLPVVFINGYQNSCPAHFSDTFGTADQVLESNAEVSLFFDTCSLPSTASIEDLGAAFGNFLGSLRYPDGQAVDLVDVVVHSMGGLVLRSYLSGKQNAAGVFQPPAVTHVRRAAFLATPHFGSGVANLLGFLTLQLEELASGSRFLFDLATWNQGTDDLRGIDAIAAVGNGGTGLGLGTMPGSMTAWSRSAALPSASTCRGERRWCRFVMLTAEDWSLSSAYVPVARSGSPTFNRRPRMRRESLSRSSMERTIGRASARQRKMTGFCRSMAV